MLTRQSLGPIDLLAGYQATPGPDPHTFDVVCLGADYDESDERAMLLADWLVIAWNSQANPEPVRYLEQDARAAAPTLWRCRGGDFVRGAVTHSGLVFGRLKLDLGPSEEGR